MHYELVDLRLLVAVVEAGGFAAASRHANLSVSVVSERMKALEDSVGVTLFERTARGSRPTAAGLEFAAQARAVLLQTERLNGAIASWRGRKGGRVAMLANSNTIASFLPDLLATFLAGNPEVIVDLREALSEEIASALRSGDADLGVAAGTADLTGLDVRPFRRDELVMFVPSGHRFAKLRRLDFAETLMESFVGLDDASAIQSYIGAQAAKLGHTLQLRIKLRSFDSVGRMVAAGVGVAVAPASTFNRSLYDAGVRRVRLSDKWATRDLVICLAAGRKPSPTTERLLTFLEEQV